MSDGTPLQPDDSYFKVARLEDLTDGEGTIVRAGVKKLALFLKDGELFCIQNFCPHAGAFLGLGDVKGCIVRCPRHSWGFDFTTGACVTNPRYDVKRYATKVEDGWVLVGIPDDGNLI
jgi:nitrite reductase/ring-hydroxylating ferredoxin subunit